MIRKLLFACLFVLVSGCATGAEDCPRDGDWAAACFETVGGVRKVKAQHLPKLTPEKSGMSVLTIAAPREVLAVDRKGVVVVPGIFHTGDFDYPTAEQGVGRFQVAGRCGFFSTSAFNILVPAVYDQCRAFREGEAIACNDCVRYCTEDECKDYKLVGGQGYAFDAKGRLLRRFMLPKLEAACGRAGVAEVGKANGAMPRLKCRPDANSPFKM